MVAPTESFVDPSIAADTGAGTSAGDPAGDLQGWLNRIVRDGTNGDRINIKAGTDEILSAVINLGTYGVPAIGQPLIFQGYTSVEGDGGIGGISGNGSAAVAAITARGVFFIDLHCHNCGSATVLNFTNTKCGVISCEVNNTTGAGINIGATSFANYNNVHNIGAIGIQMSTGYCIGNYLKNGTNLFTEAIRLAATAGQAIENIISIGGASIGIRQGNDGSLVKGNSILSAGGTGTGILGFGASSTAIINNLIEGFSGAGGEGIDFANIAEQYLAFGNAAFGNGGNDYVNAGTDRIDFPASPDNESLGASPFDKTDSDTFANRFVYFSPVDTGNVRGGAFPSGARRDKGAVQHADPAGGASSVLGGGNLRGGFAG